MNISASAAVLLLFLLSLCALEVMDLLWAVSSVQYSCPTTTESKAHGCVDCKKTAGYLISFNNVFQVNTDEQTESTLHFLGMLTTSNLVGMTQPSVSFIREYSYARTHPKIHAQTGFA